MSNVDFSSAASFAAEAIKDTSGDLNDQELTDSVMLVMEPRPSPTLQLTSVALSDEEDTETAEIGRNFVSLLRQSELTAAAVK